MNNNFTIIYEIENRGPFKYNCHHLVEDDDLVNNATYFSEIIAEHHYHSYPGHKIVWPALVEIYISTGDHLYCEVSAEIQPQFHAEKSRISSDYNS